MFHILVVDDDKNTRVYFQALLESNGYTATAAKNGVTPRCPNANPASKDKVIYEKKHFTG